jgi:hypothetical protein
VATATPAEAVVGETTTPVTLAFTGTTTCVFEPADGYSDADAPAGCGGPSEGPSTDPGGGGGSGSGE